MPRKKTMQAKLDEHRPCGRAGEVIRRMRMGNLTQQMTIQPKVPSKVGKI